MEESFLWMDKYQPKSLKELDFNPTVKEILSSLAKKNDFPHLIFYGPEGAGKKTRIHAFLEEVYGPGVHKVNTEIRELKVNNSHIEFGITSSNYHIELCPSECENQDKVIIQKVIKETSSVSQLDPQTKKKFKVIVLLEVDNLTRDAQAALRRTMEKYSKTCRLIMSCNSLTKIIPPIRSRCLSIRVACPSNQELKQTLNTIANQEMIKLSEQQMDLIVKQSENNVRKAINTMQLTTLETFSKNVYVPDYLLSIKSICNDVMKDQSANGLKKLREHILTLLVNGIGSDEIILEMAKNFIKLVQNEEKKRQIIHYAALFDNRAQNGTKAIFHIEALLARIMLIISSN